MSVSKSPKSISRSDRRASHLLTSDTRDVCELHLESHDWIPGHESLFKTPKLWSPIKARRKTALIEKEVDLSVKPTPIKRRGKSSLTVEDFQIPKLMLSSPPGVMTRSRRSSIYVSKVQVLKKDTQFTQSQAKRKSAVRSQKKSVLAKKTGKQSSAKKITNQLATENVYLCHTYKPNGSKNEDQNYTPLNCKSSDKLRTSKRKCNQDISHVGMENSPLSKSKKITEDKTQSLCFKGKGGCISLKVDKKGICTKNDAIKFTSLKSEKGEKADTKKNCQQLLHSNINTCNSPLIVNMPGEIITEKCNTNAQKNSPKFQRKHVTASKKKKLLEEKETSQKGLTEKIVINSTNQSPEKIEPLILDREANHKFETKTPKRETIVISNTLQVTPPSRFLDHMRTENLQENSISVNMRHKKSESFKNTMNKISTVDENTTKLFTPLSQFELSACLRRTVEKYTPSLNQDFNQAREDSSSRPKQSSVESKVEGMCDKKSSELILCKKELDNINKNTFENSPPSSLYSDKRAEESPLSNNSMHSEKESSFEKPSGSFSQAEHSVVLGVNQSESEDESRHRNVDDKLVEDMFIISNNSHLAQNSERNKDKEESYEFYDPNVTPTHSSHSQRCSIL